MIARLCILLLAMPAAAHDRGQRAAGFAYEPRVGGRSERLAERAHRALRGLLRDYPEIDTFWPAHGEAFSRDTLQAFVDAQPL